MTIDTKGILLGHVSAREIADALADGYGAEIREIQSSGVSYLSDYKIVHFGEVSGPAVRLMSVFENSSAMDDYVDVEPGEATLVSLGDSGEAREAIRFLVEHFGGHFLPRDLKGARWESLEPATPAMRM